MKPPNPTRRDLDALRSLIDGSGWDDGALSRLAHDMLPGDLDEQFDTLAHDYERLEAEYAALDHAAKVVAADCRRLRAWCWVLAFGLAVFGAAMLAMLWFFGRM
jgi:hypothetical protein